MAETNFISSLGFMNESIHLSLLIIPILGVVSNALLVVAFIKDPLKCFRNPETYLVMNLSVSDCLACVFYSFIVYPKPSLIFQLILAWLACVSLVSITCISIDRFLIVAYPMKYCTMMKGKFMFLCIAAIWIVSCVIPAWTVFSGSNNVEISSRVFQIFNVIIVILSSVMYSSTYCKLKKQSRNISLQNSSQSRAQEIRILKEKRFLKTIIIIAFIAFVCVVPFMIYIFISISISFDLDPMASLLTFLLSSYLFQINLAVNPLIYFLRLPKYRKTFHAIYSRRRTASS